MPQEANDNRFLKEWEEQRKGSPAGFFILYTIVWSAIFFSCTLMFHLAMRTVDLSFLKTAAWVLKYIFTGFLITIAMYYKNENRYYKIRLKKLEQTLLN